MAMDYTDIMELGFEGLDKFADKVNNTFYTIKGKPEKKKKRRNSWTGGKERTRSLDEQPREHSLPPEQLHETRFMADDARSTYAPDRRRDRDWDDGYGDGQYGRPVRADDRLYYDMAGAGAVVPRGRNSDGYNPDGYNGGYQVAPRPPSSGYGYSPRGSAPNLGYDDRYDRDRGRPGTMTRRTSSYSPPRRGGRERYDSPHRRARSKSSNRRSVATTMVGALAGGLIGNAAKRGDSALTTLAGAVVGGLGAREAEKLYERRKEREIEEDERRQRRKREREQYRDWRG